jgi:hypothetical protein
LAEASAKWWGMVTLIRVLQRRSRGRRCWYESDGINKIEIQNCEQNKERNQRLCFSIKESSFAILTVSIWRGSTSRRSRKARELAYYVLDLCSAVAKKMKELFFSFLKIQYEVTVL